jgi:hypothetical protein
MALKRKGKKTTATKTHIGSFEDAMAEASAYRTVALEMDELKARVTLAKAPLLDKAEEFREAELRLGKPVKSLKVPTGVLAKDEWVADGNQVMVLFTERYKDSPHEEGDLREAFGDKFDLFVESVESVKSRSGITAKAIQQAIGEEAWAKLLPLIEVSTGLRPRKGAAEQVARMFAHGEAEMAEDLMCFVGDSSQAPSVRVK